DKKRWRGSMYMLGYNIECQLKVRLMEKFEAMNLQELEEILDKRGNTQISLTGKAGHHLESLLGLLDSFALDRMEEKVRKAYFTVMRWDVNWRYAPDNLDQADCDAFFHAVNALRSFIIHST
ncbi:MAG: hypothetical protein ACLFUS_16580, partial [Candidatus Sumerlaeia bacterium]